MIAKLNQWITAFFVACFVEQIKRPKPLHKRKPKKHRNPNPRRTPKKRYESHNISDTLDSLDGAFDILSRADLSRSTTTGSTRRALRKLGPFIPPPDYAVDQERLTDPKNLPSMLFTSPLTFVSRCGETKEDWLNCSFFYAVKMARKPPACLAMPGVIYEVGAAFEDRRTGKLPWHCFYISIHNGEIFPVRFRHPKAVRLPDGSVFYRRESGYGGAEEWAHDHKEEPEVYLRQISTMVFNFWAMRKKMWRIVVTKKHQRMNFSIPTHSTKTYFADRDRKGICTSAGRLRPIAHYVESHVRKISDGKEAHVKAHIRGMKEFFWNGYSIQVKSPVFGDCFVDDWEGSGAIRTDHPADDMVEIDEATDRLLKVAS